MWGGLLDEVELETITALCNQHLEAIRAEMPQDIALRPMVAAYLLMRGDGPDSTKVGRVLSERNFSKIKQAGELLGEVLSSAGLSDDTDDTAGADKSGTTEHETNDGPHDAPETPTSPITEAGPLSDQAPAMTQSKLLELLQQRLDEVEGMTT